MACSQIGFHKTSMDPQDQNKKVRKDAAMREKNFVGSDGSPISRSEKLKVEFAPLVSAMHRAMTGFAPGGNWGGVAELSHLVDEPGALLRNQYGPSVYDHAPTLHGFLSIYSLLKPLPVAMELCRLADCIALPVSPEVDLDTNMPAAVGNAALAMSTLTGVTQALSQGSRLDAEARSKARDAVFEVVAFASALLARIDPAAMIAPSPQLDEDALAFAAAVQVSFSD